jgi:hypothetical protein
LTKGETATEAVGDGAACASAAWWPDPQPPTKHAVNAAKVASFHDLFNPDTPEPRRAHTPRVTDHDSRTASPAAMLGHNRPLHYGKQDQQNVRFSTLEQD